MKEKELDIEFKDAQRKMSEFEDKIKLDVWLQLYAFHKQAVKNNQFYCNTSQQMIDAFKLNAWMQIRGMNEQEAKKAYINLVNNTLNNL